MSVQLQLIHQNNEVRCSTCKQLKPREHFPTQTRRSGRCRSCRTDESRKWRRKNPEKQKVHERKQSLKSRESGYAYENARRARHRAAGNCIAHGLPRACGWKYCLLCLDLWMRREYGIDAGRYVSMLAHQKARCATCEATSKLRLDHDHRTGIVRGILCNRCNILVGYMETSGDGILTSIYKYLNIERKTGVA